MKHLLIALALTIAFIPVAKQPVLYDTCQGSPTCESPTDQ